jgi:prevent-host-death family protein
MAMAGKKKTGRSGAKAEDIGAAAFKARCLELVDAVRESAAEYVVTRHGTPVARLGPIAPRAPVSVIGCMKGSVLRFDRPFDAVPAAWSFDQSATDV